MSKRTDPKYPVYIISKTRHESMFTSRSLARMGIKHYISIEPQDYDNYDAALDEFNIRPYVTLLTLPFSNHGDATSAEQGTGAGIILWKCYKQKNIGY